MVFKPGQTSRKAFIGTDYDDAKQRQTKNDTNPLTGRFGNDITSDEVRDLKITHPNKFLELTRTPKAGEESFFAVGLCEGCTRNHPGHLSFTNHATTPYFARRPSLCGVGVCTQSSQNQYILFRTPSCPFCCSHGHQGAPEVPTWSPNGAKWSTKAGGGGRSPYN